MPKIYEESIINNVTLLIVPIDQEAPLSEVIKQFNSEKRHDINKVVVDLLIYVGNRSTRFMEFPVIDGNIELQTAKKYKPTYDLLNESYDVFSKMPEMVLSQIISPHIRNEIYERKNQNKVLSR